MFIDIRKRIKEVLHWSIKNPSLSTIFVHEIKAEGRWQQQPNWISLRAKQREPAGPIFQRNLNAFTATYDHSNLWLARKQGNESKNWVEELSDEAYYPWESPKKI